MPSSVDFEKQNTEISKLTALYSLTTHLKPPVTAVATASSKIPPDSMLGRGMTAQIAMAGQISKAFRTCLNPFRNFIKPQGSDLSNASQTQQHSEALQEITSEIFETASHDSSVSIAADDVANIAKVEKAQKEFQEKLAKAEKDLAEKELSNKEKAKPFWKKFITVIKGGKFASGKPEDLTEDKENIANIKSAIEQNNDYLQSSDLRKATSEALIKSLEEFKKEPTKQRQEIDLQDLIHPTKSFADRKEKEDVVTEAIQKKDYIAEKDAAQESNFADVVSRSFYKRFTVAEAVESGDVIAQTSNTAAALMGVKAVIAQISIPGFQQAASGLVSFAQFANQSKEEAVNRNIAN